VLIAVYNLACQSTSSNIQWPQGTIKPAVELCIRSSSNTTCETLPTPSIDSSVVWFTLSMANQTLTLPMSQMCSSGVAKFFVSAYADGRLFWSTSVATGFEGYVPSSPFYQTARKLIDSKILSLIKLGASASSKLIDLALVG
jgi:hypothetical protein